MVQRKVPSSTKLGILPIQAASDHPKLLGNLKKKKKKKATSSGHQDGKNRHIHIGAGGGGGVGGGLPELTKKMKRSGSIKKCSELIHRKPMSRLPLASSAPATPQKPSPNYMKSTSSSEARKEKERSPVSKSDTKICTHPKGTSPASSYSAGSSNHKPSPSRNSNWKKKTTAVRALTKAPSFKKYSKMGLCGEVKNVRRSTCSSTIKDSKFPPYLVLDHGGTEAQGTSVLKVCPYTYCSLNGHHHQPPPPLNCFLKAKRRSLKAQTSVELGSLSPTKPAGPAADGIVVSSDKSEDEADFFVEIYATRAEKEGIVIDLSQEDRKRVEEQNLFDEIPDSEEQPEQFGGSSCGEEEQTVRSFAGAIACMEEDDDKNSEATEMEWEQGHDSASQGDVEGNLSSNGELFWEIKKPEIVELDDTSSCCTEEVLAEELLRELFQEETEAATSEKDMPLQEDDAFEEPGQEKGDTASVGEPIRMDCLGGAENDALQANLEPQEAENDCATETVAECLNEEPEKSASNGLGVSDSPTASSEGDQDCTEIKIRRHYMHFDAQEDSEMIELRSIENEVEECCNTEGEACHRPTEAGTLAAAENEGTDAGNGGMSGWARDNPKQELEDPCSEWKWKIGCRSANDEVEEDESEFNPRDPNFLPLVPDPDAERVDLKPQTMDERKNSEEWMIDHALQQAVTKLASARRKRKVALLVEAFETVSPIPKYEPRMRHSPVFSPRPVQACS